MKAFLYRHSKTLFDVFLLLGVMVVFFYRWIFQEPYGLFTSDVIQDFATNHFIAFAFQKGNFPLWDPYYYGDIIGYLNSGVFYPFNLLTNFIYSFFITDFDFGYLLMKYNAFFHFFLGSVFMYLLIRSFKLSRLPALTASIMFAYSGYMVKEYVHIQYLQGAIWLPLIFFLFIVLLILTRIVF